MVPLLSHASSTHRWWEWRNYSERINSSTPPQFYSLATTEIHEASPHAFLSSHKFRCRIDLIKQTKPNRAPEKNKIINTLTYKTISTCVGYRGSERAASQKKIKNRNR